MKRTHTSYIRNIDPSKLMFEKLLLNAPPANTATVQSGSQVTAQQNYLSNDEHEKQKINILLEEYKALRAEIVSLLESARQITTITFTAIGVLIAGVPYIIQSGYSTLFLIAPIEAV